jgi:SulP family sulfate permease
VTGVIARSGTNIQSGARSRFSAIFHAGILLASMLALGGIVGRIPLAALAGVLTAVALRMIETRMLKVLWRANRPEAIVFLVTAGAIIVTDLIDGVQIGMIATVLYFVYEMSKVDIRPTPLTQEPMTDDRTAETLHCPNVLLINVDGPLFFASGFHMRNMVARIGGSRCVIFDMDRVSFLDVTGAENLDEEAGLLQHRGIELLLARPTAAVRQRLEALASEELTHLAACPIFDTLEDAMRHAEHVIESQGNLCATCRAKSQCLAVTRKLSDNAEAAEPVAAGSRSDGGMATHER